MGQYTVAQLNQFRTTSRCSACVHYSGCALWLSLLLMNEEQSHPGLDVIVPDIAKPCPMFFPRIPLPPANAQATHRPGHSHEPRSKH